MRDRRRSWSQPENLSSGFTLIEILVVVVIVGIVSSIVLLSMGTLRDDRDLQQEAYRMASLIELAADEAELQGRDFGIEILRRGYRFVEYDPFTDRWVNIVGDEVLRQRTLPEDFDFELFVEDRRITLADQAAEIQDDDDDDEKDRVNGDVYAPHALLLSSGDLSPIKLTLRRLTDDAELQLRIMPNGEVRIGTEEADFE
ncbi:MAG: type II secretion system minor pseudopilin GspH [Gammaproteobacteria bacterium]|nr:type II secretion system minor pseudopilin GspH [Gammaproteobacteria bacterium]